MSILEETENEILRNFILFYKKEELEENSIFVLYQYSGT